MDKYKNIKLTMPIMEKLINATDLIGKANLKIKKMKNPYILTYILEGINSISSNEIENIHTTVDNAATDLVTNNKTPFFCYRETLKNAHKRLVVNEIIRVDDLIKINNGIRNENIGIRRVSIQIKKNNKVIHEGVPINKINDELSKLIQLINEDWTMNAILKSLLIHHYFEWIHPFTDGNGRTGRVLFALVFYKFNILEIPASLFSYSIAKSRKKYYTALELADEGKIDRYLEIMLDLLNDSLKLTIKITDELNKEITWVKNLDEVKSSKRFTNMIDYFFVGIKVSNAYLVKKTGLNNKTISKYMNILIKLNCAKAERISRYSPYKNLLVEKLIHKYFDFLD